MIDCFFNPQVEKKRALSSKLQALSQNDDAMPMEDRVAPMPRRVINGRYTVQDGDTLWDLSWEFFGTPLRWREIAKLNNVPYGHIEVGDELMIPGRIEICPCCGKVI